MVKDGHSIRPGKQLEASDWLQQMHIEGTGGLGNLYHASADELQTIRAVLNIAEAPIADAIPYLCTQAALHYSGVAAGRSTPQDRDQRRQPISATSTHKVYERGFHPPKNGFRAVTQENHKVFDQRIKVLPTDEVVPAEVAYDPSTSRQVLP